MGWGTVMPTKTDPIGLLDDLADAVDAYLLDRTQENFERLTATRLQIKKARTRGALNLDTTVDL